MQYAIMKTKARDYLVDANELFVFEKTLDFIGEGNDNPIHDHSPDDEELKVKGLYYGAILIDYDTDHRAFEGAKDWATNLEGCALIKLVPGDNGYDGSVNYAVIEEMETGSVMKKGVRSYIPFAAWCYMEQEIKTSSTFADTYFPHLKFNEEEEPNPVDSILNRTVVYAISAKENRNAPNINKENWKDFIDEDRMYRVARKVR